MNPRLDVAVVLARGAASPKAAYHSVPKGMIKVYGSLY